MEHPDEDATSIAVSTLTESSIPPTVLWTGVVLRVFTGGKSSEQSIPFTTALRMLDFSPIIDYINIDDIKRLKMGPQQLVEWLGRSHAHFILSHLHQGTSSQNVSQMGWNMDELKKCVRQLFVHPGFPSGEGLNCPVFTQNKGEYLQAVPSYVNPSFLVDLSVDEEHDYHSAELQR